MRRQPKTYANVVCVRNAWSAQDNIWQTPGVEHGMSISWQTVHHKKIKLCNLMKTWDICKEYSHFTSNSFSRTEKITSQNWSNRHRANRAHILAKQKGVFAELLVNREIIEFQLKAGKPANTMPVNAITNIASKPIGTRPVMWNGVKVHPKWETVFQFTSPKSDQSFLNFTA